MKFLSTILTLGSLLALASANPIPEPEPLHVEIDIEADQYPRHRVSGSNADPELVSWSKSQQEVDSLKGPHISGRFLTKFPLPSFLCAPLPRLSRSKGNRTDHSPPPPSDHPLASHDTIEYCGGTPSDRPGAFTVYCDF